MKSVSGYCVYQSWLLSNSVTKYQELFKMANQSNILSMMCRGFNPPESIGWLKRNVVVLVCFYINLLHFAGMVYNNTLYIFHKNNVDRVVMVGSYRTVVSD